MTVQRTFTDTLRVLAAKGLRYRTVIDLGCADGHFFVVDRLKDMIITAGYNIYPAEIERVLVEHPAVAAVAVAAVPDAMKGELACAYVVLRPGASATEHDIIAFTEAPLHMALPFLAPAGIPQDRAAVLRSAFMAMVKDRDFLADAGHFPWKDVPDRYWALLLDFVGKAGARGSVM